MSGTCIAHARVVLGSLGMRARLARFLVVVGALAVYAAGASPSLGATAAGPWSIGSGTYYGSAYMTASGSPAETSPARAEITLAAGSTASAGAVLTVGCSGSWFTVHSFASGGDAAGTWSIEWPVAGSACQPGISTGSITVASGSTWRVDDGVTPTPSPTPSPTAGPVVIGSFSGSAADDVHLLAFVDLIGFGLLSFGVGALIMGNFRRG